MASSSNSSELRYTHDNCRQLEFKARTWGYIEDDDGTTIFYISGQTRSDKTVFAKVVGFQPNIIIAIPQYNNGERIKWNGRMCKELFKHFEEFKTGMPTHYETMKKSNLYGNDPLLAMSLFFRCNSAAKKFVYEFRRRKSPMYVADAGNLFPSSFKFYDEMDPILKYTALRNLSPAGWIEITETILPGEESLTEGERKFGSTDITITALHTDLRKIEVDASVIVQPTYISFDIECNSRNHNSKLPDPSDPANVIFQIGIVAGRLMSSENKVTKLLTLFDPLPLEGVEIERFKTEKSLLLDGFVKFVNSFDGDTFIGYNIMKFDWHYMIKRADLGGYLPKFLKMSRLYGRSAEVKTINWSSSAYKKQEFSFPECHGRVNLDAIIEIERNFRLPTYSLNYAAAKWLNGEGKDDVTPIELFMCYKITHEFLEVSKTFDVNTNMSRVFYPAVRSIMQKRKTHGEVRKLRRELLKSTYKTATHTIRKLLTVTGKYCVQDTVLPVKLVEKMSMWTVMQEMSNTMSVPLSFLHTRGQQIKILSQIYRECIKEGIVIPMKDGSVKASEKYQGAIVVKAVPGVYTLVGVLDFASLYPTTMIVFNIDYTTLLRDNEEWPAHLTHVLEWEDHVGCEHDPKKRKKDAKDVMCRTRRYRFKKVEVIFHSDGSVEYRNEGLLPRLEKNLLTSRSKVKKEMGKCEARIAMHTGAATEEDIANYRKWGHEIIPKGHLSELEEINLRLTASVHNAEQLAIKVSANTLGASEAIPCLLADGKTVVYRQIQELFNEDNFLGDSEGNQVCTNTDVKVWSDVGWTDIKYVVRKPIHGPIIRVLTQTGCVDATGEHSLLYEDGSEVRTADVRVGDALLHHPVPLPHDTPSRPQPLGREYDLDELIAYSHGITFTKHTTDPDFLTPSGDKKVPDYILSGKIGIRTAFFDGCCSLDSIVSISITSHIAASQMAYLGKSLGYSIRIVGDLLTFYSGHEDFNPRIINLEEVPSIPSSYVYDIETVSHHFAAGIGDLIVHNSAYGGMGAQTGFIPFVAGAESVTAMGRQQITLTVDLLEKRLNNVVVYGDTDSAMSQNGCDNPEDAINKTKADGKLITHYLKLWSLGLPYEYKIHHNGLDYEVNQIKPNDSVYNQLSDDLKKIVLLYARLPLDLEYEKMYGVMMLLTMKRYFATMINEKGEVIGFDKKGCVLSRRDNCGFLNKTYKKLADMIVLKEPGKTAFIKTPEAEGVIMNIIYDRVHELFTRQIPDSDLVIYIGIGSVIDYAKKEEVLNSKGEVIGTPFVDAQGKHIDVVDGPLDPRLVYPNIPQCILALKMTRRGVVLPANIRLEFLYVENKHWLHQGDKAEDYAYYIENKSYLGLKPDLLHYIEKQFSKPISELIDVLFPKENVMYIKLENAFKELINSPEFESCEELRVRRSEMFRLRGKTSRMRPMKNLYEDNDVVCGWDVYQCELNSPDVNEFVSKRKSSYYSHSIRDCFDRYTTSGVLNIRAQYIIDSTEELIRNGEVLSDFEVELYSVAKRWKNRYILDRLHRQHKLQIRPARRSKQTGDGLIIGVDVMVYKPFSSFPKGKVLRVVSREIVEEIGKKKIYAFGLIDPETNRVVEGVSRDAIAPFYRRDGKIMEDIVKFRTFYSEVVQELNRAFDYLTMPDIIMTD